jgi:hypothetical protein
MGQTDHFMMVIFAHVPIRQNDYILGLLAVGALKRRETHGRLSAGSCGLVLQFRGHQTSMLRVSVLTNPLLFVVAVLATLSTRRGRLRSGHHGLAERDKGLARQEHDRDVDTGEVFSYPVSKGLVEIASIFHLSAYRDAFSKIRAATTALL